MNFKVDHLMRFPEKVFVVGGGRWARIIIDIVYNLTSASTELCIYSAHNSANMLAWLTSRGFSQRVQVCSEWPSLNYTSPRAMIIANAARDHEAATEMAIQYGVPVLVEKPMMLRANSAQRLINMAHDRNVRLAVAHVFLFASYIDNFAKLVFQAGSVSKLSIDWTDPQIESRYGENKTFDPSIPVFADCLPHIVSIISAITKECPRVSKVIRCLQGGALIDLELIAGSVHCEISLARNSDRRRRVITALAGHQLLKLDFSEEPGIVTIDSIEVPQALNWKTEKRPMEQMLIAFLTWATGGQYDSRLNPQLGLQACQIIDQVSVSYRSLMVPWLKTKLESMRQLDKEFYYALTEFLHVETTKEKT